MKWVVLLIAAIVGTALPIAITMAFTGKSLSAISDWFAAYPLSYVFPLLLAARRMSLTVSSALSGACLSRCLIVSPSGLR